MNDFKRMEKAIRAARSCRIAAGLLDGGAEATAGPAKATAITITISRIGAAPARRPQEAGKAASGRRWPA